MRRKTCAAFGFWLGLTMCAAAPAAFGQGAGQDQRQAGQSGAAAAPGERIAGTDAAGSPGVSDEGLEGLEDFLRGAIDRAAGFSLMQQPRPTPTTAPATAPANTGTAAAAEAPILDQHPVVVELYTSQGCSACPPADALLAEFAGREDVIALALHVDYWDYIGWADRFASPDFTRRQKAYARSAGEKAIYTPQMVVAGEARIVGHRPVQLVGQIDDRAARTSHVRLDLSRAANGVAIRLEARPPLPGPALVQLVRYRPQETVTIERGENAGRQITYSNIVTDWRPVAEWDGRSVLDLTAEVAGTEPLVVIVQEPGPGRILAAERLQ
ncbi:DUF1223 domain-containing protein [Frigidibacter oleivorans]|uniref:DUF1223 domain-containing protein n=1 Tax=Frigidibacter oleivorans TaxID=2487129 RepID=UPI001F2024B2|nr:DUF1223 domain-containing protein [Frigidibacter oleivorans]